jgi:UDPglucose 6-dehydrogenase
MSADPLDSATDAGALMLMSRWPDATGLDLRTVAKVMKRPAVFDTANYLNPFEAKDAGFEYMGVGR